MLTRRILSSAQYKEFKTDVERGRLSHAYLVIGDDSMVRTTYKNLLAMTILCKAGVCFNCPTCEKIIARAHSDVKFFNDDGEMKVKDAETLIEDAYIRGLEGSTKIYFVDNFDKFNRQEVPNKLLKIFEEPPEGVVIFLFATSENGVLTTIKSRAKKMVLPTFTTEEVKEYLIDIGTPEDQAEIASVLSGGRIDRGLKFAENEEYVSQYERCFDVITSVKKSSDIASVLNNKIFSKEQISVTLEFFEIILRDVMCYVSKAKVPTMTLNKDYDISRIADGFTAGGVAMALIAVTGARLRLNVNVNPLSVAERMMFDILEAKYKWQ